MLGRNHLGLTIATFAPFLLLIIFLPQFSNWLIPALTFYVALMIGSLVPDADCGGNSKLYYQFKIVDTIMKKVLIKLIILIFNVKKVKEKIELEVKNEHRGILHSPIGILLSSIFLTFFVYVFMLVFKYSNYAILLYVFAGLFLGQIMHILEDSLTISGINWKFPFGHGDIRGKIYTFEKEKRLVDIRPKFFEFILWLPSIVLISLIVFDKLIYSLWIFNSVIVIYMILAWWIILLLSKKDSSKWRIPEKKVKNFNKQIKRFTKSSNKIYK